MHKNIAILGSTGSIGVQALEVIEEHREKFTVSVLTAYSNADLLIAQAMKFAPKHVVIVDESKYAQVKSALLSKNVEVHTGKDALEEVVTLEEIDVVLTAIVGYAGLKATIRGIEAKKTIALANKETLVVAGALVMALAKKHKVDILPVDSEHSAIFQCLVGEDVNSLEKMILTASGGPFRGKKREFLETVTKKQALKHPNWEMGAKITIDSSTLMNKGLEVIEAHWLFGVPVEKIDVVVHPQSIIHSMVQFQDSSIKAQMGLPDMKLPIQYAFAYPDRISSSFPRYDFATPETLTFEKPDTKSFPCLNLAFESMKRGGNASCILNAANEVAVDAFLKEKITYLDIPRLIEQSLDSIPIIHQPSLEEYEFTDNQTRSFVLDKI